MQVKVKIPNIFKPLFKPYRYKVLIGGRGSGKSWAVADYYLTRGISERIRVLCTREFQTSIKDSVHKLLSDRIEALGIQSLYTITENSIKGYNDTEFIFKGLRRNIQEIKSTEGIDSCWVEEAQAVSEHSWEILTPTIRKPGSEIVIVFNPDSPDDATYKRFVLSDPGNRLLIHANYSDNPFFPDVLEKERQHDFKHNQDIYAWKWEGQPRVYTDAQIFRGKFQVEDFTPPPRHDRFYYGADWGFAADPTVLIRCYILGNCLYIDHEAVGYHTELTQIADLFRQVPGSESWPIKADSSRPETISFMRQQGFNITGAKKWAGSVEDGIAHIRGYDMVYIHPRCKHTLEEFKLYSYKIDRNTGDVLPVVVDAYNHCVSGDSMITTDKGLKRMDAIKINDKVLTRKGYKPVTKHWCNGEEKTYIVNGKLKATGNHEIYANNQFLRIDTVRYNDVILETWKSKKQSTMGKFITDILMLKGKVIGSILKEALFGFIGMYGSAKKGLFQKVAIYTTKMVTLQTMTSIILNLLHQNSIHKNIREEIRSNKKYLAKKILITLDILLQNGINQKMAGSGIKSMVGIVGNKKKKLRKYANIVASNTELKHIINNVVLMLANLLQEENLELIIYKKYALFAVKNTRQANTQEKKLVLGLVQTLECGEKERVYDITVSDCHEFFADGMLVHNCTDSLRYSLDGLIGGRSSDFKKTEVRKKPVTAGIRSMEF